jgi:hypothetical protein
MRRRASSAETWYRTPRYANCANYPPALKESGLYFSQTIIFN